MNEVSMGDEQQRVVITTDGVMGTVTVNGVDMSRQLSGYQVEHRAGQPPLIVLFPKASTAVQFEGLATVAVADQTPPGETIAAFLGAIDPAALDRAAVNRPDLDGSSNELTKAMLAQLADWARGKTGE